jgi:hypothetical protein
MKKNASNAYAENAFSMSILSLLFLYTLALDMFFNKKIDNLTRLQK